MGRLISFIGGCLMYLCIGTILSVSVFFAVAWVKGYLNREKVAGFDRRHSRRTIFRDGNESRCDHREPAENTFI